MSPIVYLHGFGGSAADWQDVNALLTGSSIEYSGMSLEQIDSIIPQVPVICGYSMGGRVALQLVLRRLERSEAPAFLVLVSAGLGYSDERERKIRVEQDRGWAELLCRAPEEFWIRWYQQPIFSSFHKLPAELQNAWLSRRKLNNLSNLSADLRELGPGCHGDLSPGLQELARKGVKVLYIAGELDEKYSKLAVELSKSKGIETLVLADAGHILPLEKPRELAAAISEFIGSHNG